jgi:peptidyl-prolyl cis-trans isomerase A (cyclophilin A)
MLAMANRNEPNTNGSQFYITLGPQRRLDSTNTVFGRCGNNDVISRIGRVPTTSERPQTPVTIETVRVYR